MSKKDHIGKLDRRAGFKPQYLGYYIIVTDGKETEPNFFNGIKNQINDDIKNKVVIKVKTKHTKDLIDFILEELNKSPNYAEPWIVFDKDEVMNFDELIYKTKNKDINVAWSNPCIEILFLAYFGKNPTVSNQKECISRLEEIYKKETNIKYEKNEKKIYEILNEYGDERRAIEIMDRKYKEYVENTNIKPSKMNGVSIVYNLIKKIKISGRWCEKGT